MRMVTNQIWNEISRSSAFVKSLERIFPNFLLKTGEFIIQLLSFDEVNTCYNCLSNKYKTNTLQEHNCEIFCLK